MVPPRSSTKRSGCPPDSVHTKDPEPVPSRGRTVRLSLPAYSGEENRDDEDSFERWVRKLEKYAELGTWSDREKLVQLEIHLAGQDERLFEVLPKEPKGSFNTAVDSHPPEEMHSSLLS